MVPYFHFTCIQFCLCHKVPFSCKEVQRLIRPGAGVIGDVLMSLASSRSRGSHDLACPSSMSEACFQSFLSLVMSPATPWTVLVDAWRVEAYF